MAFDNTLDIAEMLADFGITVTKSDVSTFTAILVDEYEAQTVYGLDVDSSAPVLTCKSTDVATLCDRGDTVTINSIAYKVHSTQEDGTGVTVLVLGQD